MERTDRERILEKINTACNILDGLRAELINADRPKKKRTGKRKENVPEDMNDLKKEKAVRQSLERYEQPTDSDHIASVLKIVNNNGISLDQLDSCLERIKAANDREPKKDIRKYTYSCLYKVGQERSAAL